MLLVAPAPLSLEEIAPVVLLFVPPDVPVTFSEIIQLPLAASVPPDKLTLDEPAVARRDPVHVGVGRGILRVAEIEPWLALDDACAHGRDRRYSP